MAEYKLFEGDEIPEHATDEWYETRDRAAHLEEEMHKPRLQEANKLVLKSIAEGFGDSVVDLGAGDGGLLSLIRQQTPVRCWGYDLQPSNVAGAIERGVDVRLGNAVEDDVDWAPIAIATEVIEHLVDPHAFVRKIAQHSNVLVCSSPWNEHPGAAYGFHLWAWDQDGYRALLENNGFQVNDQITTGMFQVLRGVRK